MVCTLKQDINLSVPRIGTGGLAIIAGSDTTSTAITHLFYFLMCNPAAYKRLQAEVDELGDDILDCTKQAHMPYLNASMLVPLLFRTSRDIFVQSKLYIEMRASGFSPQSLVDHSVRPMQEAAGG
jgi:hypothetical protein